MQPLTADTPMITDDESYNQWTIDKRIPISVLLAILLQSAAVIIWAMTLENRIVLLERTAIRAEQIAGMSLDIALVKQDVAAVKEDIRRLSVRGK